MYSIDIIVLDTTKGPLEPGLGGVRRFDVHIILWDEPSGFFHVAEAFGHGPLRRMRVSEATLLVTLVSRSKRGPRGSDGQK
jgi:hypothetical protein